MTLTLRQESDVRATTKGSALTYAEMDANFLHALDTGTIVVGDDSSGATIKLGDTLKIAGGSNITTAMSGNTLTITGSVSGDLVNDTSPQLGGNLDVQARTITTSTSNGDIGLVPNGDGKVDVGTGSATGIISSSGAHNLKLETNDGTNSGSIQIIDGTGGNIEITPSTVGKIVCGSGSQTAILTSSGTQDIEISTNSGTNSGKISITDGANGDISIAPNGSNARIKVGATGEPTAFLTSNGGQDLKLECNSGTGTPTITLKVGTNGNIELAPSGTGEFVLGNSSQSAKLTTNGIQDMIFDTNAGTDSPQFAIRTGQHANDSAPDKGILEFDAKGIGGAVFINNEDAQAYPTGAMILRNNGANDSEIHFGQFGQGPAVGKSGNNTLFFSVYFDPDAKAFSHSDSSSFPGDANVFFGYDYDNNQAIMQGNGGDGGFKIDSFGNQSTSYASGQIELAGSYALINGSDPYLQIKERTDSTIPSQPSNAANLFAMANSLIDDTADGSTVEMYAQDSANNFTKISPHNADGEWEFYSRNTSTGKTVRVNMEKMIRKLEQITGETFFEEFKPARS